MHGGRRRDRSRRPELGPRRLRPEHAWLHGPGDRRRTDPGQKVDASTMTFFRSRIALVSLTLSTAVFAAPGHSDRPNKDINTAYRDLGLIAANEKDLAHSGASGMTKKFADHAEACSAEVKKRLDGGEAGDTIVKVTAFAGGPRELKLGEVEATVCR